MKRKGFTWIELLVIVAVLAVIAAILFPVFARMNEPDRGNATCMRNLKNIALGFRQYVQDYDEAFPIAKNSASGLEKIDNWIGQLEPYVKSQQIFQCPVDGNAIDNERSSYGYNSNLSGMTDKKIGNTSIVVLNFEVVADPRNRTQTGSTPAAITANERHLDGAYYSFADGHVKWLKPGNVGNASPTLGKLTFVPG